jgi:hypothetical protein
MIRGLKAKLAIALAERTLIRIVRKIDETKHYDGYVVALCGDWILMAAINDAIRPNGFDALRLKDVSEYYDPAHHAAFVEAALAKRKIRRPEVLDIDMTDAKSIVAGANKYPLVTIHREIADPDVCHIGRVSSFTKQRVLLLEITPDATWEAEPTPYALSEITKIDFGDPYAEALALVSAAPRERVRSSDQW